VSQPAANSKVIRFGLFELDLESRELRKAGIRIKLHEQPFLILDMLLKRPGVIVPREELKKKLWSEDTFVDFDLSLNSAVKKLRQALSDDSDNPRYIETLYRRGYRFIGSVNGAAGGATHNTENPAVAPSIDQITVPPALEHASAPWWRRAYTLYAVAVLVLLGLIAGLGLLLPARPPKVLGYTQITHDGLAKGEISTDGERLYFMELQGSHFVVSQVSVAGGDTSVVPTPSENSVLNDVASDGSDLHPMLPAWNREPRECCGTWTSDGKYFLFQSFREGRSNIWALPEKSSWWSRGNPPLQVTNGPLSFYSPAPSRDGKRIFATGAQPRGELIRYDNKSGFVPYLEGISASDLAFSIAGNWIAYVSVPERQLWKCKIDGSQRRQLTFDSITVGLPRWSPDGTQIVFMAQTPTSGWRAYVISSDGTRLRELIPGAQAGYDPGWSPDGKSIVLTLNDAGTPSASDAGPGLVIFDVSSGKLSPLPGGRQLFSPRWSPDGRHIAAITHDSQKLMLFDRDAQQWQVLVTLPIGYPSWSRDGQYIYFDTTLTEDANLFRVRISDRKLERLVSLKGMSRLWADLGAWTGLAPNDSPLLIRDISSQEIYAIEWQH